MPKRKRDEGKKQLAKVPADSDASTYSKKSGWDEIDNMFEQNKKRKQAEKRQQEKAAAATKASSKASTTNSLSYTRQDIDVMQEKEWKDDGLGGKFNKEGFTGRTEGGLKVFKAHLFNRKNFGSTDDCPFDCDCCYI
mmetsp:Transcript_15993/g.36749  ORF Transcript_15993/g.36749 Transcript_15993/m.36749 type:complete len:137 (-) Transcript_15993:487-897(-)